MSKKYKNSEVKENLISFQGKIHLISNDRELSKATIKLNSAKELGFDTETRPSFKKRSDF